MIRQQDEKQKELSGPKTTFKTRHVSKNCERVGQKHHNSAALLDEQALCVWRVFHPVSLPLNPRHSLSFLSGVLLD